MRKNARRNTKNSSSSVGDQSLSPDLITASCDEILLHLADDKNSTSSDSSSRFPADGIINPGNADLSKNPTNSIDSNISIIDCAEDCLNDDDFRDNRLLGDNGNRNETTSDAHSNNPPSTGLHDNNHVFEGGDTLERTFSDALIIPDPFEREPDDLLSPDTNIHDVNNLIV